MITRYRDTENWTLVNNFTLLEEERSSGRSYKQTKVPKHLWLDVKDIHAVDAMEWFEGWPPRALDVDKHGEFVLSEPEEGEDIRPSGYVRKPYITARAETDDRITIFNLAEGAIEQFSEFAEVRIYAAPKDRLGGKYHATFEHGIEFSGMDAKDVPEPGMMKGEPGCLLLVPEPFSWDPMQEAPFLALQVYLEQAQFDVLFANLVANGEKIEKASMLALIELFEGEAQATMNEPWMRSEYGLLLPENSTRTRTPARIDRIQLSYLKTTPAEARRRDTEDWDDDFEDVPEPASGPQTQVVALADETLSRIMHSVRSRLGWMVALLILVLVFLSLGA